MGAERKVDFSVSKAFLASVVSVNGDGEFFCVR